MLSQVLTGENNYKDLVLQLDIVEIVNGREQATEEPLNFTWEILTVNESSLMFDLVFDDPFLVSNSLDFDSHGVSVKILKNEMFYSAYGDPLDQVDADKSLVLIEKVPLLAPKDESMAAM